MASGLSSASLSGTTLRWLDLLELHEGWVLIDGGELWAVTEWVAGGAPVPGRGISGQP